MKTYAFAMMAALFLAVAVLPSYATPSDNSIEAKNEYLKTLKVPAASGGYHSHMTNVKLGQQKTPTPSLSASQQEDQKARGNFVAGQPWGQSTVVAKQATQAQQAQNSHQAQNAHQATQYQMPNTGMHQNQGSSSGKLQIPKPSGPAIKLP